jgi:hypothetical protein
VTEMGAVQVFGPLPPDLADLLSNPTQAVIKHYSTRVNNIFNGSLQGSVAQLTDLFNLWQGNVGSGSAPSVVQRPIQPVDAVAALYIVGYFGTVTVSIPSTVPTTLTGTGEYWVVYGPSVLTSLPDIPLNFAVPIVWSGSGVAADNVATATPQPGSVNPNVG